MKKFISICTSCYNEEGNITELCERLTVVMSGLPQYDYEIIIADNFSTDGTRDEIRALCSNDTRIKAIFNIRNFGHERSPHNALKQATGDAVINMCSDLEDVPELVGDFIREWEKGQKVVLAVRRSSAERGIYPLLRKCYYTFIGSISDTVQVPNFTGFGLYDRTVIDTIFALGDPLPYFRGLVPELGFPYLSIPFDKPYRKRGITKGSMMIYYDTAMRGMVNSSRAPLRLATFIGLLSGAVSMTIAMYYLVMKLLFWDNFQAGIAPIIIVMLVLFSVLFALIGIVGEYIGLLVGYHVRRPLVIEEERINFQDGE